MTMNRTERRRQETIGRRSAKAPPVPDADGAFAEAVTHQRAGQLRPAKRIYERILRGQPKHADALHLLGVLESQAGRHGAAVGLINKAIRINPHYAESHYNLGNTLTARGDVDGAVASYRRAIEITPTYAKAHYNLGNALHERGRPDEAIASYERAIEIDPNHAKAHFNLGKALAGQGRPDEAIASYRRAVAGNPGSEKAHRNLGDLLMDQGRPDEALASYQRARAINPDNQSTRHLIAALTGDTPDTAPAAYVQEMFDGYAERFDAHLVDDLDYQAPNVLRTMLTGFLPSRALFTHTIDLGCGTGLAGAQFRGLTEELWGVDVSPQMIEQAEKKNIYDHLETSEILNYLKASNSIFDVFVAADVFIYVGDLRELFTQVYRTAGDGALFVFSTELHDGDGFVLRETARYAHAHAYVENVLRQNSFSIVDHKTAPIRKERGSPVSGCYYIAKVESK
jgi:predicted TPR repeat methyltransferase